MIHTSLRQEFEGEVFSFFSGPAVTMVVLRVVVEDMLINVACTFLAIFFVSLVFTLDVVISFFTLCAVAATVVDAAGLLFFWGVSIDPFFAVATL